jgi:hypothetical protein
MKLAYMVEMAALTQPVSRFALNVSVSRSTEHTREKIWCTMGVQNSL